MVNQLKDRLRVLEDSWQQFFVEFSSVGLELGARQMTQVVIGLSNELLCIEERVDEQAAARDLPWHPAVEALIKFALWHL